MFLFIDTDGSLLSLLVSCRLHCLLSELRQVPDNQEVYMDTNSDMSIVIELLTLEPGKSFSPH
jgi:Ran-interacting Mog1 protein